MKNTIYILLLMVFPFFVQAQSTEILPGSVLPKMTTGQRTASSGSFTEGMLVFDTDLKKYFFRSGTSWVELGGGSSGDWGLNGNNISEGNFIGTINNENLIFKVNGQPSGRIERSAVGSISLGFQALNPSSTGSNNIAFGTYVLYSNTTGISNIGIGVLPLVSNTTGSNNIGIGTHALYSNSTGSYNIGIGFQALYSNTEGGNNIANGSQALYSNTTGGYNIANGSGALRYNTSGSSNIANGYRALYSNTEGGNNIANGSLALNSNTTGNNNIGIGTHALYSNSTGSYNIGIGRNALFSNTSGNYNIANGDEALYSNISGINNIAIGYRALNKNTGTGNSAIGAQALSKNTNGSNNTVFGNSAAINLNSGHYNVALGFQALNNLTSGSNNIAIGYNVNVPSATANNQVRIGNTGISYAGIQVAWTVTSDRRLKKDIQANLPGLNFVNHLNPVSYIRKNDEEQRTEYGFIAQEIEEILKSAGIPTNGIIAIDDNGMYSLRYNDFIAISVKAIQELSEKNNLLEKKVTSSYNAVENLKLQLSSQDERLKKLENQNARLEATLKILLPNSPEWGED